MSVQWFSRMNNASYRARRMASALFGIILCATNAWAVPGDPDPSFGDAGKATFFQSGAYSLATAVAAQADGKIVVGGITNNRYSIMRLDSEGRLDPGFSGDGVVQIGGNGSVTAMAIQADGKIVSAGTIANSCTAPYCIAVSRLHPDGAPDSSFGGPTGMRFVRFNGNVIPSALLILPDGNLLVAGVFLYQFSTKIALVRLLPNGQIDRSFGRDGRTVINFPASSNMNDLAQKLVALPDGRFLVVGRSIIVTGTGQTTGNWFICRFQASGRLDRKFADNGRKLVHFGVPNSRDEAYDAQLLEDGKLLVAGGVGRADGFSDLGVARFDENGQLDRSFARRGRRVIKIRNLVGQHSSLAVAAEGKIILGSSSVRNRRDSAFTLLRLDSDGTLDPAFGIKGVVKTDFNLPGVASTLDTVSAIVLQSDGRIVAAGSIADPDGGSAIGVARYLAQ